MLVNDPLLSLSPNKASQTPLKPKVQVKKSMGGKAGLIAKKRAAKELANEESSGTDTESEDELPPAKQKKKEKDDSESLVEYDKN